MKKITTGFLAMLVGAFIGLSSFATTYSAHAGTRKNLTDVSSATFGEEIDTTTGMHHVGTFEVVDNVYAAVASGAVSGTVQGIVSASYTAATTLGLTGITPTAVTSATAYRYPMHIRFSNLSTGIFNYQMTSFTAALAVSATGVPVAAGTSVLVSVPVFPIPYTFQWAACGTGTTALNYSIIGSGRK